jgi:hypothetical protein
VRSGLSGRIRALLRRCVFPELHLISLGPAARLDKFLERGIAADALIGLDDLAVVGTLTSNSGTQSVETSTQEASTGRKRESR